VKRLETTSRNLARSPRLSPSGKESLSAEFPDLREVHPELWVARSWQRRVAKMQVICAWCRDEGKRGYLGEREPFDNPAPTHGVCLRHREQFLESLPSTSFPDVEMLIVVRSNDTALYEYLLRRFAGVRGVKVILERRQADQGRAKRPVADERRHQERRIRQGKTFALGYTVIRFKRHPPPGRGTDRVEL
jgi:hypothetical protein